MRDTSTFRGGARHGCLIVLALWFVGVGAAIAFGAVLLADQGRRPSAYPFSARTMVHWAPASLRSATAGAHRPTRTSTGQTRTSTTASTTTPGAISTSTQTRTALHTGTSTAPHTATRSRTAADTRASVTTHTHTSTSVAHTRAAAIVHGHPRTATHAHGRRIRTRTSATATAPATAPRIDLPRGGPPTTLVEKDLIAGTGATARAHDTVTVRYVGEVYGRRTPFYSSWQAHRTYSSPLEDTRVIRGWVKGIAGMRVGGRRELIVPPGLGYGSHAEGEIPANSTLVFVVDLLRVSRSSGGRSGRPSFFP
jgi:FKBP-type peptidyl-prolyl cis-trans isomerase